MNEFRTRLSENGRIIIPASCRRQLHLKPGQELIVTVEEDGLHIFSLQHSLKKAQQKVRTKAKNQSLVKKLLKMRREDSRHG
jgi:AbrB family looped-hinge helix DNA binding protein